MINLQCVFFFNKSYLFLNLCLKYPAAQATQFTTSKLINWSKSLSHALINSFTVGADLVPRCSATGTQAKVFWSSGLATRGERQMRLPKSSGVWKQCASLLWLHSLSARCQARPRLPHLAANRFNLISSSIHLVITLLLLSHDTPLSLFCYLSPFLA